MFVLGAARAVVLAADWQPPASVRLPEAGTTGARKNQLHQEDQRTGCLQDGPSWRNRSARLLSLLPTRREQASNTCPINSVCEGFQTPTAAAAPAKEGMEMQII